MTNSIYGLAPCVFYDPPAGGLTAFSASIGKYRSMGIYAINGPNWADDLKKICDELDQ